MHRVLLATRTGLGVAVCLLATSCVPFFEADGRQPAIAGTKLGATISEPAENRNVARGTVVNVRWSGANLTGADATATIIAHSRRDFSDHIIAGGIHLRGTTLSETTRWDTSDAVGGEHVIRVRLEADGVSTEATAAGRIIIDEPGAFQFTEPAADIVFRLDPNSDSGSESPTTPDPNSGGDSGNSGGGRRKAIAKTLDRMQDAEEPVSAITFRWTAEDEQETSSAEITLDTDDDPDNGNEIVLTSVDLPQESGSDSFDFSGRDAAGVVVPAGDYGYFARVTDDVNEEQIVRGLARIVVLEAPDAVSLAITKPGDDMQFLATDTPLHIEYTLNEPDDVLVDLRIDTDDNHSNGNELVILADRLVESGPRTDTFDWNGSLAGGGTVPDGIYRVFLLVNRGAGTPETKESPGLVFRRAEAGKPLIAMLQPASDVTVTAAGTFITLRWRDDDPDETATVRLRLDDDPNPQEAVETGAAEIELLSGRSAKDDGVSDTYAYQVPSSLAPGTYYVFAYIDRDGAAPFEHASLAPGRIIIKDPNAP
jgi:flagellar hook assembly protein FlgD